MSDLPAETYECTILTQPGAEESFYSQVTKVTDPYTEWDGAFMALCTIEQFNLLNQNPDVRGITWMFVQDEEILQDGAGSKTVYHRRCAPGQNISTYSTNVYAPPPNEVGDRALDSDEENKLYPQSSFPVYKRISPYVKGQANGNWGLIRHTNDSATSTPIIEHGPMVGPLNSFAIPDDTSALGSNSLLRSEIGHKMLTYRGSNGGMGFQLKVISTESTYNYNHDGEGVDVIIIGATVLAPDDPEFKNADGTTRLKFFDWTTLPGQSNVVKNYGPGIDYMGTRLMANPVADGVSAHAAGVAYMSCSNTYGAATGADIYCIPRNQIVYAQDRFECCRQFHKEKKAGRLVVDGVTINSTRPTIVIESATEKMYNQWLGGRSLGRASSSLVMTGVEGKVSIYRDSYANGVYDIQYRGTLLGDGTIDGGSNAGGTIQKLLLYNQYGTRGYNTGLGNFGITRMGHIYEEGPIHPGAVAAIATVDAEVEGTPVGDSLTATEASGNADPVREAINRAHAEGVHYVSSAGNETMKICLPDNIDYNNAYFGMERWGQRNLKGHYYNRGWRGHGDHTIVVAAIDSGYDHPSHRSITGGKEVIAAFSNRGDRCDTAAAGHNIPLLLLGCEESATYIFGGTSAACPMVGGLLACVLEKYPTTTPAQLRKFVREQMISSEKLYDPGDVPGEFSRDGDPYYFQNPFGLQGYSGNIAYLDPAIPFDPSTITDTSITAVASEQTGTNKKLNFTVDQINTKLASI